MRIEIEEAANGWIIRKTGMVDPIVVENEVSKKRFKMDVSDKERENFAKVLQIITDAFMTHNVKVNVYRDQEVDTHASQPKTDHDLIGAIPTEALGG